ncbi:MAG: protein kinase [Gemmataceae bacterium]
MRFDACLSDPELEAYQLGKLSKQDLERVMAHLQSCPECAEEIERFDGCVDTLLGALRHAQEGDKTNPRLHRRLSDLNIPSAPENVNLDFLSAAQQPQELGRFGSYRVLEVLGVGGMGVVLLVEDPALERRLAIKVMKPELAAEHENRQRFLREARAAAAVEHPSIVPIYQVGEVDGVPFLAMPLLRGESLNARIRRAKELPVAEAVRIARQTAAGLEAAHEHGLIHRDIKPGNIWLDEKTGQAKLLDFGLARNVKDDTQLTTPGTVVGTPAYMAPEQAANGPLDHRCDLFSLGAVLYRMLTGKLPFAGTDTMSMLVMLATETPTPPRELNPAVPKELDKLVMKMLAKEPAARPASAQAVIAALDACDNHTHIISEEPVRPSALRPPSDDKTRVLGAPQELRYKHGRSRLRALLIGLAAAGALLAVIVIIIRNKDGSETRLTVPDGVSVEMHKDGKLVNIGANAEDNKKQQLAVIKWLMEEKGDKLIEVEKDGRPVRLNAPPTFDFKLRTLNLHVTDVPLSAQELKRLSVLVNLESLSIGAQPLTDDALRDLTTLVHLRELALDPRQLTPQSISTLGRFPKLENLMVSLGKDEWVKGLVQLPNLRSLRLYRISISAETLNSFKDCPRLSTLGLFETNNNEAELLQLQASKQLRLLEIKWSNLEDVTFEKLAKAMPWCEIRVYREDKHNPIVYNKGKAEKLE